MSKELELLVNDLQGNMDLVGSFLDSPSEVLEAYNISGDEKEAMLSKNVDDLNSLGFSEQLAVGALSGAHSQTCPWMT